MKRLEITTTSAPRLYLLIACSLALFASSVWSQQRTLTARDSTAVVDRTFGPRAAQWLAELRAIDGVPQPAEWHMLAFDPRASHLLRRYWVAGGQANDQGPDVQRYPKDIPVGYFTMEQVRVDSVAAFTIAEGEARRARMAFDSCNYLLRVREYSSEPIWRLELLDTSRRLVGKIYISAQNGEVLRTLWVYYNQGGRIVDSAAPGAAPVAGGDSITSAPAPGAQTPPAAGSTVPSMPSTNAGTGGVRPFTPVPPGGFTTQNPPPPPGTMIVPSTPAQNPPAVAAVPPPANSTGSGSAVVPPATQEAKKPDPTKPPVPSSGSGSSGRIPPPPIPQ